MTAPPTATAKLLSLADIDAMGEDFEDFEVIDGLLVEREGMGRLHGRMGFDLGFELALHIKPQSLGELYTSETNFVLSRDPLIIVKPDISFVRADRLPAERDSEGFLELVPDLAVEVRSPSERTGKLMQKVERYRQAGVPLLWLVESRPRTVRVFAAGEESRTVGEDGELDGGTVLPGFRLPVARIFR